MVKCDFNLGPICTNVQKSNLPGITRIPTCQFSLKFTERFRRWNVLTGRHKLLLRVHSCTLCKECLNMLFATVFLYISIYVFLFFDRQYGMKFVEWSIVDQTRSKILTSIVHKCLYSMYTLLFLVSVLFGDWRIQKAFLHQCAVQCLLWMCNCWWFDTYFWRMIHTYMLGFTMVYE